MNREQINYIIQYADVVLVAEKIGVPMQDCGDRILILCPGHEEHTGHMDRNFGTSRPWFPAVCWGLSFLILLSCFTSVFR